jgi:hypothetical protein
MATINGTANWSGIESEALDSSNWVQVAYRNSPQGYREYLVFGEYCGERFEESFHSDADDNKRLAYSLFYEKLGQLESL